MAPHIPLVTMTEDGLRITEECVCLESVKLPSMGEMMHQGGKGLQFDTFLTLVPLITNWKEVRFFMWHPSYTDLL